MTFSQAGILYSLITHIVGLNHLTNREIHNNKFDKIKLPTIKTLAITTIFGLVLGFLGPFGSYRMPAVSRFIYWVILFNIGYFAYFVAHRLTYWYFQNRAVHPYILFVIPTLVASIPLSLLVGFATQFLLDKPVSIFMISLYVMPQVIILGIVIDTIMRLILRKHEEPIPHSIDKAGQVFINRLPTNIGDKLICFVMEDHYLVVYTDKGSHMMLMRMKDALIELNDYPGMQVHRSYWVALDAVVTVKKEARKTILTMTNNIKIPVSRKYLAAIKQASIH